jgi:hypothetical protein
VSLCFRIIIGHIQSETLEHILKDIKNDMRTKLLTDVGKISRISIRDEFPDEARNFTPWLKENLHYLGEKLNIDFRDAEVEVAVGRYSCDILAHDSHDLRIVIENQFGSTNHDHLGKILTYSAGLEADIIIWIAEDFLPEHITALNWLNEIAIEEGKPSFFAVKVSLIKIDDSRPALEVNPIVHPDEWARRVKTDRGSKERSEKSQKYYDFWKHLIQHYDLTKPGFKNRTPTTDSWYTYGAGKTGMKYVFYFYQGKYPTVSFDIDVGNEQENRKIFQKLKLHSEQIDSKLHGLEWYDAEGTRHKSIDLYRDKEYDVFSQDDDEKKEALQWLSSNMQILENVLTPLIKEL